MVSAGGVAGVLVDGIALPATGGIVPVVLPVGIVLELAGVIPVLWWWCMPCIEVEALEPVSVGVEEAVGVKVVPAFAAFRLWLFRSSTAALPFAVGIRWPLLSCGYIGL